jgi:hypothetical protein
MATVAVSPADAMKLMAAQQEGTLYLALRPGSAEQGWTFVPDYYYYMSGSAEASRRSSSADGLRAGRFITGAGRCFKNAVLCITGAVLCTGAVFRRRRTDSGSHPGQCSQSGTGEIRGAT